MKYMLIFLVACAVVGLWTPPRANHGRLIFGLTVVLLVFFWLYPSKL